MPASQEGEAGSSLGCLTSAVCLRSRGLRSLRGEALVSGLLRNLLTSLLLALQQAFVGQAEPFTPHQRRSLACHLRQSCCLSATKETQQTGLAWLTGRGGEDSLLLSAGTDKAGATEPASWGASNSHIVWEPGPPWPRTALHAVCPLSSSGHPSYH